MGREPICKCGFVKLWHGAVMSSQNSQHVADWYTFSHVIHGFGFYWLAWLLGRKWPSRNPGIGWSFGFRLLLATIVEAGWEVLENTSFLIDRYRGTTASLDYYGDSVLNSTMDIVFMIAGFLIASRIPVWITIALAIGMEVFVLSFIRDNLTLNIIMLIHPFDAILEWQRGAG